GVPRHAPGQRPREQHALVLQTEVPVQARRAVLLDDEPGRVGGDLPRLVGGRLPGLPPGPPAAGARPSARLRGAPEVPACGVLAEPVVALAGAAGAARVGGPTGVTGLVGRASHPSRSPGPYTSRRGRSSRSQNRRKPSMSGPIGVIATSSNPRSASSRNRATYGSGSGPHGVPFVACSSVTREVAGSQCAGVGRSGCAWPGRPL